MLTRVIKAAETFCSENKAEEMNWSWGEALLMYSLTLLDELNGDALFEPFYCSYAESHYSKGIMVDQSDTCAPALLTHQLYKKTGDERFKDMTMQAVSYLKNEPRLIKDLINHNGHSRDSRDYPKSIWVDSLMMSGVFGAIAAADYDDAELMRFALKQPLQFTELLRDNITGLYHHSWWKCLNRAYPKNLFWGRGNGWAAASFAFMYKNTGDSRCAELLQQLSAALIKYQRDDFYFDTVINKPGDNYRESSATALIAAAWFSGLRSGILKQDYLPAAANALSAVAANMRKDGSRFYMTEISLWTIPMFLMPYRLRIGPYPGYKYVKKGENITYGLAALILAVVEYEYLKKEKPGLFCTKEN